MKDRTGQDREGQYRTGKDSEGQGRAGKGRSGQGRAGKKRAGKGRTGQLGHGKAAEHGELRRASVTEFPLIKQYADETEIHLTSTCLPLFVLFLPLLAAESVSVLECRSMHSLTSKKKKKKKIPPSPSIQLTLCLASAF